jgi:hypothetical protein
MFRIIGRNIDVNGRALLLERLNQRQRETKARDGEPDKGLSFLIYRSYFKKIFLGESLDE